MKASTQRQNQAIAARLAAQSFGHLEDSGTPCPTCAREHRRTGRGTVPTLRRRASDGALFCMGMHGQVQA